MLGRNPNDAYEICTRNLHFEKVAIFLIDLTRHDSGKPSRTAHPAL
jgi:hypothetical protein